MTTKYGMTSACTRCGQDIQWFGRKAGWRDRGNNRQCATYEIKPLEFVTPRKGLKHTLRATTEKAV